MKAMILAAGLGTRLHPLTHHTPKPLLKVGGMPLIYYHIEKLVAGGVGEIVINVSHLADQIKQSVGDGSRWGVAIQYSDESVPLETAGGIVHALPLLGTDCFICVNADVWTDYPFAVLPQSISALAHLVLVPNPAEHPHGDFVLAGSQVKNREVEIGAVCSDVVSEFVSEAVSEHTTETLTFAGISVLNPALFAGGAPVMGGLGALLRQHAVSGHVTGERYQGSWFDVGTPARLVAVDRFVCLNQRAQFSSVPISLSSVSSSAEHVPHDLSESHVPESHDHV